VIANGENAAAGFGLTTQTAEEMFAAGVDFITSGNHIWDKREFRAALDEADRIVRPANYPPGSPGRGAGTFTVNGVTVGVLNVMGRVFMPPVDDPFRVARGDVSFVFGTHTHVQTSDEQILPGGTAYLTDVGMTGPSDGIIGMETGPVLDRFTSAVSERFAVQKTGTRQFCAAVATVDVATGRALDVKRIYLRGLA
jgi:calcineurin-like phosphoesterase